MAIELLRAKTVFTTKGVPGRTGLPRATGYKAVREGLLPPPIAIGPRAKAFVGHELDAVAAARIRGATDDEVRALVRRLVEARKCAGIHEQDGSRAGRGRHPERTTEALAARPDAGHLTGNAVVAPNERAT